MKWSAFMLGGLAGAAVAVYAARKRPGMFAWAGAAAGEAWDGMKGRAVNAVLDRKFRSDKADHDSKHSEGSGDSWNQIEEMLNQDPHVKRQAEEIMAEATKH
ncbi:hypothetical protein ACFOLF_05475 [Paenibacillus sepulcri]|uniref:YtxH domain-containing protein n=1 Tax=Paenibacillus sepulcri TaxID=359917 RepID=A0ABS7C0K9_9BACL|nr:hypothetical protein [Paenibacillus sepulcri]